MRSRVETIALANDCSRKVKRMGPVLSSDPTREEILRWCLWCDRNGVYTDENNIAEGMRPLTLDEAWECIELLTEEL